jgi:hypothetical protein
MAGGQYVVIAVQVALVLLSILCVHALGRRVGLGEAGAGAAAAVYGLLPQTLVFPHQLATEAIFVPLVILAFSAAFGARSGIALGAATLIRPITILWPFIHSLVTPASARTRTVYLLAALAPIFAWMGFILFATGEFSMGRSGHDLGHNLYERMHRTAAALPEAERPARRPPGQTTAGLGEYAQFVAQHPMAAALHSARDFVTLGVKSGIERLVLDYLDLFPESRTALQDSQDGWRAQVEQRGLRAAMMQMLSKQPGLILVSALAALFFAAFMVLALAGAWAWLREASDEKPQDAAGRRLRLLIIGFVVYIFLTAQAVDAAQSRHRAPAEFALCLLVVAGWLRVRQAVQSRRGAAPGALAY